MIYLIYLLYLSLLAGYLLSFDFLTNASFNRLFIQRVCSPLPPLVQPTGGISLSTRILESYVFHLVVSE